MTEIPSKITVGDYEDPQVLNIREALDIHALEYILPRESRFHKFHSKGEAANFQAECIDKAISLLGVKNLPRFLTQTDQLNYLMSNGIWIKHPTIPKNSDFWRRGFYVYQQRPKSIVIDEKDPELRWELAYFISDVLLFLGKIEQGGTIKIKQEKEYHIRTNVRL